MSTPPSRNVGAEVPAEDDPFGWVGATVDGKYRVDEVVGHGGFGIVYRAHHLGFEEKVALKCLKLPKELQGGDRDENAERVMPHIRFLNASEGLHMQKWQYKRQTTTFKPIGNENKTVSHDHLANEGWQDLPDGVQRLCYNEIPTKVNWSYLRFDFDLETMKALSFACNDRSFDMSGFESIRMPAMKNLWCMLNFCLFAETDVAKRAFLYVDSICISGDF